MNGATVRGEHWVLQRGPRLLFSLSAIVTTTLIVLGVIANLMLAYQGRILVPDTVPLKVLGVLVGVVGASAALWLWVGMCWYWVQLDHSSRRSKIFWFLMLLLGNWVGATAYYFFVYQGGSRIERLDKT